MPWYVFTLMGMYIEAGRGSPPGAIMNICIIARKGGVGKSTASLLIAEALRQTGKRVAIHDWDDQGTSSRSSKIAGRELAETNKQYDFILYDTPPNLDHLSTATAVRHANVILIMTTPNAADLWEAKDAADFAIQANSKAIIRVLVNKVKKGTLVARSLQDAFKVLQIPIPALTNQIQDRQVFAHFLTGGWSCLDVPAQLQVANLVSEILTLGYQPTTSPRKQNPEFAEV
jgi:chromosome partitioning protein